MKTIPLSGKVGAGLVALVDDEDYELVSRWSWRLKVKKGKYFYARAARWRNGMDTDILMHTLLLSPPPEMFVDHVDGNGLNNQRSNLRLATNAQNQANQNARQGGTSRFKGVYYDRHHKGQKPWRARITKAGRKYSLGRFATEEEAARSYDAAAKEIFKEFANLNLPPQ